MNSEAGDRSAHSAMTTGKNPSTVLVVEDNEALRRLVQQVLVQEGFRVIEAPDGAVALALASECAEPLDLLLTDVIMPNMNGLVLADRLLQDRPGTRVIYMSGYMEGCLLLAKDPDRVLLQKPFTAETRITTVRKALGSA